MKILLKAAGTWMALMVGTSGAVGFAAEDLTLKAPDAVLNAWNGETQNPALSYDAKVWVQSVVSGKDEDAAHQWAAVKDVFAGPLRPLADATYLYLVWNAGLPQTFLDELIVQLRRKSFVDSAAWKSLEPQVHKLLPVMLTARAMVFTPDQKAQITMMPWDGVATHLKAWSAMRSPVDSAAALANLPGDHPWRHLLELAVALDQVRHGKIAEAIEGMKKEAASREIPREVLPAFYLQIARLYYQQADLASAETWYLKVPEAASEIADAREELLWVWLRKGDQPKLRGTLYSLKNEELKDHFMPELYVVKTISNLKLCHFEEAKIDFANFVAYNQEWAEKIDQSLKAAVPALPPNADWYARLIDRALTARGAEAKRVKNLFVESVAAAVPAIGKQKHWADAQKSLENHKTFLEGLRTAENRRQWRNNGAFLQEAIRKMRFVKVELLSQLSGGAHPQPDSPVSKLNAEKAKAAVEAEAEGKWSFPFDGVVWPDEKFATRSTQGSVCL